jgi:hypothetical protein
MLLQYREFNKIVDVEFDRQHTIQGYVTTRVRNNNDVEILVAVCNDILRT